ncbi:MAG: EpsG family protein, partial [Clostridium saudiense]|nr:EpsG family protein [Clostridium saudiense]
MAIYLFYLVYFIIITFFYLNKKKKNRNNKKYLICAFLPLILIAGLRSENVGIDTKQFTDAFKTIVKMDPSSFGKLRYEYGFSYLCWVLGKLSIEPKILIFSTSFFINFSVARFIYKNSENIPFSTVLYILCNFFFSYMNIMRQAIAIAIILWGYEYLKKNKYIRFCIFVMIASLFHGSAILALIFIFLKKFEYNKYFIGIVFCVSIISILFGKNLFMLFASISPRLFNYVGGNFDKENYVAALLNFIVYLVSYIFGFICLKKSSDYIFKNKENK